MNFRSDRPLEVYFWPNFLWTRSGIVTCASHTMCSLLGVSFEFLLLNAPVVSHIMLARVRATGNL